jgi:thiol-disulfide isomerase/thioredoxin
MSNPNLDPEFDGIFYLEKCDFTSDGKLIPYKEDINKVYVVMIFATWCGPCKVTKPEYAKLLKEVDSSKVRVACINGSGERGSNPTTEGEQELMKSISNFVPFKGFPTICIFGTDGTFKEIHNGPRTVQAIKDTISKHI